MWNKHEIKGLMSLLVFILLIFLIAYLPCNARKANADEPPKEPSLDEIITKYHQDVKEAFFLAMDKIKAKQIRIIEQDKELARLNGLLAEKTEELAKAKAKIKELDDEINGWSKYFKSSAGFTFYHDKTFAVYLEERIFIYNPLWIGLEGRYAYAPSNFLGGLNIGVTF